MDRSRQRDGAALHVDADPAHLPLAVPLERLRGPLEALRGSNIRSISCLRAVIRVHGFKLRLLTPSGLGVLAPATR
jgi:hypothetical protein